MKKPTTLLTIERSKNPERGLKGVRLPATLLIPVVDSTQPFRPVVQVEEVRKREASRTLREIVSLGLGIVGGATPVLVAGASGWLGPHTSEWSLISTLGLSLIMGGIPFASAFEALSRVDKENQALVRHSARSLKRWLSERYSIEEVEISETAGQMLVNGWEPGAHLLDFADGNGKQFKLMAGEEGLFVEEKPEVVMLPKKDYAPSGTVAALSPAKVSDEEVVAEQDELVKLLVGDAQVLHSRTLELLAVLDKRALSTESQHVVKRVQEDVRQMLVLNRELRELTGADSEAQAHLAVVLSNLNDELAEVLEAELASVKKSIAVQMDYVKNRRRPLSGLMLTAASAQGAVETSAEPVVDSAADLR